MSENRQQRRGPATAIRLGLTLAAALAVAWGVYFLPLMVIDQLFGVRQFEQALLASPGRLLRAIAATIVASAPWVVPAVGLYGLVIIVVSRSHYLPRTLLAIAAGVSMLVAALLWIGFTPMQTLPFALGFCCAMVVVRRIWCEVPR